MYFVLLRTVGMLHKTDSAVFISLLDIYTLYQYSTFSLWMSKLRLKGNGLGGALYFLVLLSSLYVVG